MTKAHTVILGGGVIGLSAGITFLERTSADTFQVTLVSKDLPPRLSKHTTSNDKAAGEIERQSSEYASAWAGAHHVSAANSERELRWDKLTFEKMKTLQCERPWDSWWPEDSIAQPLAWVNQVETFHSSKPEEWIKPLEWYPDFEVLPQERLPRNTASGCRFSTLDINVPLYLPWLRARFEELGGVIIQRSVDSVAECIQFAEADAGMPVTAVVVCPGLGARKLLDVRDHSMYPLRGQVARVHAPSCDSSIVRTWSSRKGEEQHRYTGYSRCNQEGWRDCYIIPMGDGTFVVGGTRIPNDWSSDVRPETTKKILEQVLQVFPELANVGGVPLPENVKVNSVGVGLRPARKAGARLEEGPALTWEAPKGTKKTCRVIYAYGFGGFGYQASWGIADDVWEIYARPSLRSPAREPRLNRM
ncbi:FAD dependent oxidoreductase [Tilletiaria anomala UBC 951]|uniref:FAD dependent oxidoreductase n=1 Tax=Tilletiaria anomala (strain ATCC 24038 / CBS 436.72 / UBC 951) TaxID=1037660 RepID=A0A066WIG9_TILAU|nr:FAD dependent oxidoreductase [Tilletiaria anomala UBC 951]KDN53641.1 FAD dependent oxidoreductase [Tilletiaria anomala UBC 951]